MSQAASRLAWDIHKGVMVAHTGIEPVISALRGRRPWPLDECALPGLHHNPADPICQVRFWHGTLCSLFTLMELKLKPWYLVC